MVAMKYDVSWNNARDLSVNEITVINLHEYFTDQKLGENSLKSILSEFSCELNKDVEDFLIHQAIEFTKKNQSVTYLVFSNESFDLLGYFTLAIKPITIMRKRISKAMARKIERVSTLNPNNESYVLSAYLIAQLGKNYSKKIHSHISGKILLGIAIDTVRDLQFRVGGMVTFIEVLPNEKLLNFYQSNPNSLKVFGSRTSKQRKFIQLLKVL